MIAALVLLAAHAAADASIAERVRTAPPFAWTTSATAIAPRAWTVPAWMTGRVLTREWLHVGVRPHLYADGEELAAAVTLQLRFDEVLSATTRR